MDSAIVSEGLKKFDNGPHKGCNYHQLFLTACRAQSDRFYEDDISGHDCAGVSIIPSMTYLVFLNLYFTNNNCVEERATLSHLLSNYGAF